MKKTILVCTIILLGTNVFGQTGKLEPNTDWIVRDHDLSSELIENYQRACILKNIDFEVQKHHELMIYARIHGEGISLSHIDYIRDNGAYRTLSEEVVSTLNPVLINKVLGKKYRWDDIQPPPTWDIVGSKTVFEERDSKSCRDTYWWTRNAFEISSNTRWVYRPVGKSMSVLFEPGFNEAGYPGAMSKNIKFGIANEITYIFISLPSPMNLAVVNRRPLDGAYGGGFRFDTHRFGGSIAYSDIAWSNLDRGSFYDKDNILYLSKHGQLFVSLTTKTPPIRGSVKMNTDSHSSENERWPPGSLRLKMGVLYNEMVYKQKTPNTSSYKNFYATGLDAFRIFTRVEYVSDKTKENKNVWNMAVQWNFWNFYELYSEISYQMFPLLDIGLLVGMSSKRDFYDNAAATSQATTLDGSIIIAPFITFNY